ncbi:MAG: hypothetical protein K6A63_04930 [Acholeplasmatales bacterium]|nr:hypothetical protein [Acholeplasmatales bacterium]
MENNENKFKINSDYNSEEIKKITTLLFKILSGKSLPFGIGYFLLGILLIILFAVFNVDSGWFVVAGIILVIGLLSVGVVIFSMLKIKGNKPTTLSYSFLFLDDVVKINIKNDEKTRVVIENYSNILKVISKHNYIFMIMPKSKAYAIRRDENSDKLLEFLKTKVKKVK